MKGFTKNEMIEASSVERYFEKVFETKEIALDICNEHLSKAGLKLSSLERSSRYFIDGLNASFKNVGNASTWNAAEFVAGPTPAKNN